MSRSDDLKMEAAAMARIEAAYASVVAMPDAAMRRRVLRFAAETYPHPDAAKLARQVRAAAQNEGDGGGMHLAALALADAVDPPADAAE